jgi:hypothetical protein
MSDQAKGELCPLVCPRRFADRTPAISDASRGIGLGIGVAVAKFGATVLLAKTGQPHLLTLRIDLHD